MSSDSSSVTAATASISSSTQPPNRPPLQQPQQQQGSADHADRTPAAAAALVGPTSAELESLNELIKFDHVYYKVTTPGGGNQTVTLTTTPGNHQTVTVVPSQTTPIKEDSAISVSVVPSAKQSPKVQQVSLLPKVSAPVLSRQQSSNSTYSETDLQLPEIELPPLDESFDQLFDLDNILTDDLLSQVSTAQTLVPTPTVPVATTTPQTSLTSSGYPFVSKDTLQVPTTKLSKNNSSRKRKCSTDLDLKSITFQQRNQRLMSDDIFGLEDASITSSDALSPRSDSSFLGSPQSEGSLIGDDGWQESFTELFPTLV